MNYVRIKFKALPRPVTCWAIRVRSGMYERVHRDGSPFDKREIILTAGDDVVFEKEARMNLKYAELEVA